uniref:J domain-containing protein n=1 Tax=Gongylonema pulchrum TaxID=637853 RepID=A0A183E9W1_9BILA
MSTTVFRYEKLYSEITQRFWMSAARLYSSTATAPAPEQRDLYETLGVEPSATGKEIKAAYYRLSKLYHPDRHDGEEQKRRQKRTKFCRLIKNEKNMMKNESCVQTPSGSWPTQPNGARTKKNFEDLGLDYKTFEEFQRSMPDEFFEHFGTRQFTSTFRPQATSYFTYSYKDTMQRQRELKEWQILKEIEEEKRKTRYKIPTFLAMEMQRKQRMLNEKRTVNAFILLFGILMTLSYVRRLV